MTASTISNLQEILKDLWLKAPKDVLYKNKPLMGLMPKDSTFLGRSRHMVLRYSAEPGGSATFATAKANKGPSSYKEFEITRARDYALGSLSTELYRAAKGGDTGAVVDAMDSIMKGLQNTQSRSLCLAQYRNGGGARGQISSAGAAATTFTLADPNDSVNFEVGMKLEGSAADGTSGAVTAGGAAAKIVSINRDTGVLTNDASANWNAPTGINSAAASWYLFRAGDFGATLKGLDAWIPATVTSTSFFGIDRTADTERLAGCRCTPTDTNNTYSTIEGACLALLRRVYMAGGSPDHIFMHPNRFKRLVDELQSRRQYVDASATDAKTGYRALLIEGQGGSAKVLSDPNCQVDVIWGLTLDTWKMSTLGEPMSVLDDDNNAPWLRESDDDALELRMATYGQFYCDAPAWNGRASVSGI